MKHGVVVIIFRKKDGDKEYLLMKPKKIDKGYEGFYRPVGGWIEKGEDEERTVVREVKEEIGRDIKPLEKIDEIPGDIPDLTLHFWVGILTDEEKIFTLQDIEVDNVKWFSLKEILEKEDIYPATKSIFKKHKKFLEEL